MEKAIRNDEVQQGEHATGISVIVPVYNTERYVAQCLDSVLNQTFRDYEVIIIDDGSTDRSFDIIQKKYIGLPRVRVLRNQKNIGVSRSRNQGIRLARGKYVYFIDSDDVIFPQGLECLYQVAEKYQADIIHSSEWYVPMKSDFRQTEDIDVNIFRDAEYCPEERRLPLNTSERVRKGITQAKYAIAIWLNLYRRDFLLEKELTFPVMRYEDNVFTMASYCLTDRIWTIPTPFYLYRQRQDSFLHDMSTSRLAQAVEAAFVGDRYVLEAAARAIEPLDAKDLHDVRISLFSNIWNTIKKFYDGTGQISLKNIQAVEQALHPLFPEDAFLIGTLLHLAADNEAITNSK